MTYAGAGFVHIPGLLDPELARGLRADIDAFATEALRPSHYGLICHNLWRRVPACATEIERGELAARVMQITGEPALVLFQDHLIAKLSGTRDPVSWHQDYSYWPLDAPRGATLWIALDDADPANGCLRYIPGTHRLGEHRAADFIPGATDPDETDLPVLDAADRESDAVDVPTRTGDAIVHHPLVWHMSPPNPTDRPRRAWSLSFIAPDVCWAPAHSPHPFNHQLHPRPGTPPTGALFPRFEVGATRVHGT